MRPRNSMDECDVLVHYLVGTPPTAGVRNAYYRALQKISITFSDKQQLLWNACLRKNRLLPFIDAYLAFSQPHHPVRKKLFIMLAVLETQPAFSSFFLPVKGSFFEPVIVLCRGMYALIKIGIGRLLVWII